MRRFWRRDKTAAVPAADRQWLRRGRAFAGYAAVALLAFGLGCYLFFPTESLRERLVYEVSRNSSARLEIENLSLRFPPALLARNLTLSLPGLPQALAFDQARVAPNWLTLFGGNPGIAVEARLLGGALEADLRRNGNFVGRGQGLSLQLPLAPGSALALGGTVRELNASGSFPTKAATANRITLTVEKLRLSGVRAIGSAADELPLGTLTLVADGQGNSLRIEKLLTRGGALEAEGSGNLLLAASPAQSRLNLALTLKPSSGLDPSLRELLGAFAKPAADGSLTLRLSGSLAAPKLQ